MADISSETDAVIRGFKERIAMANTLENDCRFDEALEAYQSVLADIRTSKTRQNCKEEVDGRKALMLWLEKMIRISRSQVKMVSTTSDSIDRDSGSPEPPADPDVWGPPTQPAPKAPNKKTNNQGSRPREQTKSTSSTGGVTNNYGAVDKSDRPANQAQSILPPNKAGETFDATFYDAAIVQAVRSTMELSTENRISTNDVIGMENVKQVLHEAITLPLLIPGFFQGLRSPWKAMCLAGPPGTGKTLIARAIASESSSTFFTVSSTDLSSKWRGESEKIVRLLFELARFYAPSIIFIDEIDTLAGQRGASGEHEASRRVKSELLVQMDGARHKFDDRRVFVLAATNIPWDLDEALRRRFEKRIFVPLPNQEARKKLIEMSVKETKVASDVDFDHWAKQTEGYSGSDVVSFCRAAAYNVLRRFNTNLAHGEGLSTTTVEWLTQEPIRNDDFRTALSSVQATVNVESLQKCKEWCESFGSN